MVFKYPWLGLEKYIVKESDGLLRLFAYGSLMNAHSSAITLKNTTETIPAIGYGFRRVFNYPMNDEAFIRYGRPDSPEKIAALNVIPTSDNNSFLNGIVIQVHVNDIENLRKRELDYTLHELDCMEWETNSPVEKPVFILSYPFVKSLIDPHPEYLKVCIQGAESVSEQFKRMFLQTTYMFDNETCLNEWLQCNNSYEK